MSWDTQHRPTSFWRAETLTSNVGLDELVLRVGGGPDGLAVCVADDDPADGRSTRAVVRVD